MEANGWRVHIQRARIGEKPSAVSRAPVRTHGGIAGRRLIGRRNRENEKEGVQATMMEREQPLRVELGGRSYEVRVGPGVLDDGGGMIRAMAPSSVVLVTGTGVVERYATGLSRQLQQGAMRLAFLRIQGSERCKTLSVVRRLYRSMLAAGLDRSGAVIAVGGGVVCDTVGFAAGTYMRGVALVLVPTTLLAQVDACIGGKTAVNLPEGKNLIGVFHQPSAVLVDTRCLQTLPARQLRSGLAELVKHGFIRDPYLMEEVLRNAPALLGRDAHLLGRLVRRSLEVKAAVVMEDEREVGPRAILNFGHTVGHAIETLGGYRRWTHGEAVAMGMVTACLIGEELGLTPAKVRAQVVQVLRHMGLPIAIPADLGAEDIVRAMRSDKKARAGILRFVLLREIGCAEWGVPVEAEAVAHAIQIQRALE